MIPFSQICSCNIHGIDTDPDAHAPHCTYVMWCSEHTASYTDATGLSWFKIKRQTYQQRGQDVPADSAD